MRSSPHIFRKEFHMAEVDKETFDVSREALGIEQDTGEANTVAKVVEGEVVQTKKNKVQKVAETFFGGDLRDVASYVVKDVIIPAAKDMLYDTVSQYSITGIYSQNLHIFLDLPLLILIKYIIQTYVCLLKNFSRLWYNYKQY